MSCPSCAARRSLSLSICVIVAALVLVPTLVRALQHLDPYQPISNSVRLNWNGDAPPTKADFVPRLSAHDLTVALVTSEPDCTRVQTARRAHAIDDLLARPPFVRHTDPQRGPPAAIVL
jgi:hypothetical protein